jgi:hypothetical protein
LSMECFESDFIGLDPSNGNCNVWDVLQFCWEISILFHNQW